MVEGWVVGEEWRPRGAGEGDPNVVALEDLGGEGAQAGEGGAVGGVCAAGPVDEGVVHGLGFRDVHDGGEGLGFRGCGVEETVVAAAVCCHQEGY